MGSSRRRTSAPFDLGSRKHLFIDLALVERSTNVVLRANPPRIGGVAIHRDRGWEHRLHWACTVLDDGGLGRMWYRTSIMGDGNLADHRWCYAESMDGIRWHKPNLTYVPLNSVVGTNMIPVPELGGAVFIDPSAPPEQRYKMFGRIHGSDPRPKGFGYSVSSDGFEFTGTSVNGISLMGDTLNQVHWDPELGKYVVYIRGWKQTPSGPCRTVVRWVTSDLASQEGWALEDPPFLVHDKWAAVSTELPTVIQCDDEDPPDMDIYTPSIVKYPGADDVYVSTMSMYRHYAEAEVLEGQAYNDGIMEVQLAVSRDGEHWSRPDRRPYVRIDPEGPGSVMVYSLLGMIVRGDWIYQYVTVYDHSHGLQPKNNPGGEIRWTEQRLDGFVSIDAYSGDAEVVTHPLNVTGDRLELNIDCGASGDARVEIQDAQGKPLEGHDLASCDRILGNHIHQTVTWGGSPKLKRATGAPVRLRIALRASKLYAFQFLPSNSQANRNPRPARARSAGDAPSVEGASGAPPPGEVRVG